MKKKGIEAKKRIKKRKGLKKEKGLGKKGIEKGKRGSEEKEGIEKRKESGKRMEVIRAKSAGFCFGVKRAVEKVYEQLESGRKIYTFGPIIHNEEVVKDLESQGVVVVEDMDGLRQLEDGTVVIRSHGVAKDVYELLERKGLECVDATCPFVKKSMRLWRRKADWGKGL